MKKHIWILLILLLASLVTAAVADTIWYCPNCGRRNDDNYCPHCGTKRPKETTAEPETVVEGTFQQFPGSESSSEGGSFTPVNPEEEGDGSHGAYTTFASVSAMLNQRMATRTGPGTVYDEPGSFFSQGTMVTVLSKAFDDRNKIWWVQIEFVYKETPMRAYTGVKRLVNLDLNQIPEEREIGQCTTSWTTRAYYGPSFEFREIQNMVPRGVSCRIFAYATDGETDFLQVEFYDSDLGRTRRAWIPDQAVGDYTLYEEEEDGALG